MLCDLDEGVPKYIALQRVIGAGIDSGQFPEGERIPAESVLAKQAKVARMTVRQAIGALVADGVLERRHGSGTYVCRAATGRNLALLFFGIGRIDMGRLSHMELECIREAAHEQGRQVRVMVLLDPLPDPAQIIRELRQMDVGAVGFYGFHNYHRDYIRRISRAVPSLLLNKKLPGLDLPCAKPDLVSGARLMVDHFVRCDRLRIGVLVLDGAHSQQQEVVSTMAEELQRRDMPILRRFWYGGDDPPNPQGAAAWVEQLLAGEDVPDAMVVHDDISLVSAETVSLAEGMANAGRGIEVIQICEGENFVPAGVQWWQLSLDLDLVAANARDILLDMVSDGPKRTTATVAVSPVRLLTPEHASTVQGSRKEVVQ